MSEDDSYNYGLPEKAPKFLLVDGPYGTDGKEALPYFASLAESTPGSKHTRALYEAVLRHGCTTKHGVKSVQVGRRDEYIWPVRYLTHLPFDRNKDRSNLLCL